MTKCKKIFCALLSVCLITVAPIGTVFSVSAEEEETDTHSLAERISNLGQKKEEYEKILQKNAKEMLEVYERVVEMAIKQHKKYPLTKSWFVGVYKDFDVKKAQEAIDAYLIAQAAAAPVAASAQ